MKLFTVKLTDDERARLEAHRVALGLRSHSEVVRHWIARGAAPVLVANGTSRPVQVTPTLTGSGLGVTLGPAPSTPGSRLKKR